MATEKEIAAVNLLVAAALKVNASSKRVNVHVEIDVHGVDVRVCDPVVVTDAVEWGWLFYSNAKAYFSDDVFREEEFLKRCNNLMESVLSFEGRTVSESE